MTPIALWLYACVYGLIGFAPPPEQVTCQGASFLLEGYTEGTAYYRADFGPVPPGFHVSCPRPGIDGGAVSCLMFMSGVDGLGAIECSSG